MRLEFGKKQNRLEGQIDDVTNISTLTHFCVDILLGVAEAKLRSGMTVPVVK